MKNFPERIPDVFLKPAPDVIDTGGKNRRQYQKNNEQFNQGKPLSSHFIPPAKLSGGCMKRRARVRKR